MKLQYIAFLSLILLGGCSSAGTWENDSENWQRAFGSPTPSGISVGQSYYTRTPHFSYEARYFFEITSGKDTLVNHLNAAGFYLVKDVSDNWRYNYLDRAPAWFPGPPYEGFQIYGRDRKDTLAFISESGSCYTCDSIGM